MTLDEYVATVSPDTKLFIGAKDQFFFIGTPEEYESLIDRISEDQQANLERLVEQYKHECELALRPFTGTLEREEEETAEGFADRVTDLTSRWRGARNLLERSEIRLSNFQPIRSLEVVDIFVKDFEPGIAIKVKGQVQGLYWSSDEWEKKSPYAKKKRKGKAA